MMSPDEKLSRNREYQRVYRERHREARIEYQRAWRASHREGTTESRESRRAYMKAYREKNKEALRTRHKAYREDHSDTITMYMKSYRAENREAILEAERAWMRANPLAVIAKNQKRRTAKISAGPSFTKSDWQRYLDLFGERCLACGSDSKLTVDHVVPLVKGGSNTIENLQGLCQPCNSSKGAKTYDFRSAA